MNNEKSAEYANKLSQMIKERTVSGKQTADKAAFHRFGELLKTLFPELYSVCEAEDFDGSILLRWRGKGGGEPIMLMNHHDVVEAPGEWKYPPFSGEIADGKLWGRGTLDTKGGLFCMLEAADSLAKEGFCPECDVYFVSTCNEECDGKGADAISTVLAERGIHFKMVLDEGGMIIDEPIGGAKGKYAMIGIGEKGCADLKFIARSSGGHASTPGKNTPLVRLGKFMAEVEKGKLFDAEISNEVSAMLYSVSRSMSGGMRFLLGHNRLLAPLLSKVMPKVSDAAGAMLKTTVAFTMASGSDGANVLPREAWVVGNMRYSHHQGRDDSIEAIRKLAKKYGVETEVLDGGFPSPLSSPTGKPFKLIEQAVEKIFPDVRVSPYVMTAASDSRFMSRVSEECLRFTPFIIDDAQLASVHGVNENVDVASLEPAVEFYRYLLKECGNI